MKNKLKRLILKIKLKLFQPNRIDYIFGSSTLPPPLSKEEEASLMEKLKDGDESVREELITHNLRLVVYIARKFDVAGAGIEDLISIGTIGLIKAVKTYSPEKNIKLATYASRCIENEILMHFRNAKKSAQDISLNETIDTDKDGNPLTLLDIMSVDDNIIDNLDLKLNSKKLGQFIREELNEREQKIIVLRYGLDGKEAMTQKSVAKMLGISRSYVSRIETKALKQLRKRFETSSNL